MKKSQKLALFAIILSMIILGCTTKKNPVSTSGNTGPQPHSITIRDTADFGNFYSYEDTTKNYANNAILTLGQYTVNGEPIESRVLLRYASLPDTVPDIIQDATITMLVENNQNDYVVDDFQLFQIAQYWKENEVTWTVSDSLEWAAPGGDFSMEPVSFTSSIDEDTLSVSLDASVISNWIESDSLNFGLIFVTSQTDAFVEFASAESGHDHATELTFKYRSEAETEFSTFTLSATSDASINSSVPSESAFDNQLLLANLSPTSMVLNVALDQSVFPDSIITSIEDYNRMGIVRAELFLHFDDSQPSYSNSNYFFAQPYLIKTADSAIPISTDDIAPINSYVDTDTLNAGYFAIDITDIVDGVTSGQFENHGILIKPGYPGKDFSFSHFYGPDAEEGKRPYIKIIYIPPYNFNR